MDVILIAVIVLGAIGLVSSLVLFFVSKKFAVKEDPRIAQVSEVLPQANCGGCGFPGCGGLASACVKAADNGSLEGLNCPVGGQAVMERVAEILGMEASAATPKIAVVRCNGSCENRPRIAVYDGVILLVASPTISFSVIFVISTFHVESILEVPVMFNLVASAAYPTAIIPTKAHNTPITIFFLSLIITPSYFLIFLL